MSNARFRRSVGGVTALGLPVVWCPQHRKGVLGGPVALRLFELLDQTTARRYIEHQRGQVA
jgi:hypothetical protein